MAATAADLQQLVNTMAMLAQAMTANARLAAASVPAGSGGGKAKGMRYINPKAYSRVTNMSRGEEDWKEFYFDIGVILGTESPDMLKILQAIEAKPGTDEFDA